MRIRWNHFVVAAAAALVSIAVAASAACEGGEDVAEVDVASEGAAAAGGLGAALDIATATPFSSDVATTVRQPVDDVVEVRSVLIHDVSSKIVIDPLVQTPLNAFPFGEVYAGLVRAADDLSGNGEPDLAESWRISEDGLSYTFSLRDDLRFSDGSPLTATDFKWSWERALSPEYVLPRAREVLGEIRGAAEMLDGDARTLSGVTVVDDVTLTVELARPQGHFVQLLADPVASVLSEDNFNNWGTLNWVKLERTSGWDASESLIFAELPVGAGPFRIADYDHPKNAVLEPNPHRWDSAPVVDEIIITDLYATRFETPRQPAPEEFDTRRIDSAEYALRLEEAAEGTLESAFDHVVFDGAPRVAFLALNTALAPFDDVEFRRALFFAADRSVPTYSDLQGSEYDGEGEFEISEEVADLPVLGFPENSAARVLPPGFPGYVEGGNFTGPLLERASEHLSNSRHVGGGYGGLQFVDDGSTIIPEFFDLFSETWIAGLGIEAETYISDIDDGPGFVIPVKEFNQALADGTLQMRYVHVEPRYPDPCAILCRIPDLFGPNALSEETEQLREMLHDAAATADRAARIAKYQAIEAHILDRALVIPAYWDDGAVYELVRPYISGYKVPAYGGSRYEDVVVDTTHPDYPADR